MVKFKKMNYCKLIKRSSILLIIIGLLNTGDGSAYSQEKYASRFEPILSSVDSLIGAEKEMILRLSDIDFINEKIVFYDEDNIDIIFDITKYKKDKLKVKSIRNAHEGVRYKVRFIIKGKDPDGLLSGQLIEFFPFFMDIMQ